MRQPLDFLYVIIFIVAVSLRFMLAVVNREANDNHMEVIHMIMQENELPRANDCWQCFHSKLFHYTIAKLLQMGDVSLEDTTSHILVAQFFNALAGTMTITIIWVFLKRLPMEDEVIKLLAFTLAALNPKLIGINAQVTNDSLVILLTTLGIYSTWQYLRNGSFRQLLYMMVFLSLGIATKATALAAAAAIALTLLVMTWVKREGKGILHAALFIVIVSILSFLNPLTQYQANYRRTGSILLITIEEQPFPAFFETSYAARPGITSIQDGIFTFKFRSLLEHPRLTNEAEDYPAHRTSLWTQIYARANSVHFDNWPPSWGSEEDENFALSRAVFVLALLPTGVLLAGALLSLAKFMAAFFKGSADALFRQDYGLFDILFWGYIAFIILYSLRYRDFSVMKAIFIYPALLSFVIFFVRAGQHLKDVVPGYTRFPVLLAAVAVPLAILYILDICVLAFHLGTLTV